MASPLQRREFLKNATATPAIIGLGELDALAQLGGGNEPVSVGESGRIELETDRLAKLMHKTPREKLVGVMIRELQHGVSYRHFLSALYVASVRHGAMHQILAHNAVHQLSMSVGREERFLPLFWHLDTLKLQGAHFRQPKMSVKGPFPSPAKAASAYEEAMEKKDAESAHQALIALARSEGPKAAYYRHLLHVTARPTRSYTNGHKLIWGANSYRSQAALGWRPLGTEIELHRFPMEVDLAPSARANFGIARRIVNRLPGTWASRKSDSGVVLQLLAIIREGKPATACQWAEKHLMAGKLTAGSVWDAVFLGAAELMWGSNVFAVGRAVHCVNTANALHYVFRTLNEPQSRLLILLHAIDWTTHQHGLIASRRQKRGVKITDLAKVDSPKNATEGVEEIFTSLPPIRAGQATNGRAPWDKAAQLTFAWAGKHADHRLFLQNARRLLCLKATADVHCVKFPVFQFENYAHATPRWRPHLLAASAHFLHGTRIEDNPAMQQAREELKKL